MVFFPYQPKCCGREWICERNLILKSNYKFTIIIIYITNLQSIYYIYKELELEKKKSHIATKHNVA